EIANSQVFAGLQLAGDQRQAACEGFDQRRFAGPVRAKDADARAWGQLQLDMLQNGRAGVAQCGVVQIQQRTGLAVRLAEAEVERRVDVRRAQQLHSFQCLETALRLTSLGRLGAEPGDV